MRVCFVSSDDVRQLVVLKKVVNSSRAKAGLKLQELYVASSEIEQYRRVDRAAVAIDCN